MINHIRTLQATRDNIIKVVDSLSLEQLNKIPAGYNNNVIWNAAHCVVTQQLLVYKLSGEQPRVSDELIAAYKIGAQPSGDVTEEFVAEIKSMLIDSITWMEEDYAKGLFKGYNEYTTSYNVTLSSTDDAILFNNVHEALHLGYIMAMRKVL
jgi:hypothetical protein